jgi:integrase
MINLDGGSASPTIANDTVQRGRKPNSHYRPREHLTEREVEKLIGAARGNRNGQRDAAMILMTFRHGLRASEVCELQWSDVQFDSGLIYIRRAKGGTPATHPLLGDELRALRALRRESKSPYVFVSERGAPFSVIGFRALVKRAGVSAGLPFLIHPHQLRHACGYALANKGTDTRTLQAYLGHKNIQHTVRYTELAPGRFKDLWR